MQPLAWRLDRLCDTYRPERYWLAQAQLRREPAAQALREIPALLLPEHRSALPMEDLPDPRIEKAVGAAKMLRPRLFQKSRTPLRSQVGGQFPRTRDRRECRL